jgi:hypothetical protein
MSEPEVASAFTQWSITTELQRRLALPLHLWDPLADRDALTTGARKHLARLREGRSAELLGPLAGGTPEG